MEKILIATQNPKKITEISFYLKGLNVLVEPISTEQISEEIPETGLTLTENALQKARYVFEKTGMPCFADDTGLEIESLKGEPGVYSARYAGLEKNSDKNMDLVLSKLGNSTNRKAQFVTIIAYKSATEEQIFEGKIEGEITFEKQGTQGFGYDPIFKPLGHETTFAQMSLESKNQISHRARALAKLKDFFLQKH